MPKTYRCTKTVISDFQGGTIVFTKGRLYEGHTSATPSGHWAMQFTNDLNEPHLMNGHWLYDYFVQIPELDITSHADLERWLASASPRQIYQAIEAAQEWLNAFKPETEDDSSLAEAVKDRLDVLERAYQLAPESGMEAKA